MGLPSFLQRLGRRPAEAAASRSDVDAVGEARARARRRLIGAVVLLLIGVIGFPLLFETQPRPVAVDVPIVIPARDGPGAPVLSTAPAAQTGAGSASDQPREVIEPATTPAAVAADVAEPASTAAERKAGETAVVDRPVSGGDTAKAAADRAAAEKAVAEKAAADKAAAGRTAAEKAAADKAAAAKAAAEKLAADKLGADKASAAKAADAAESARARALLEGRAPPAAATASAAAAAKTSRMVVQVGAYADDRQMQKVRQRLEQLGYKTYTQVVTVRGQRTTRVRVGPFDDRAKADEVAERVKAAGLPAAVLAL